MGANTKQLKTRIRSVTSTMHITKAMELVASSKLRKAQNQLDASRPYADAVQGIMSKLSSCDSVFTLEKEEKKILVVCIAGDRGLAGGYNNDIYKKLAEVSASLDTDIIPVGKRMTEYAKSHGYGFVDCCRSVEKITLGEVSALGTKIAESFAGEQYDAVYVLYTRYLTMLSHTVTFERLLPVTKQDGEKGEDILFEPGEAEVLAAAVPEYIAGKIYGCVSESFSSELSARRNAMDSASKNASAMIDDLSLKYNRARQGAITQEITEIIGGSEAN